jgi:hypothetical protein
MCGYALERERGRRGKKERERDERERMREREGREQKGRERESLRQRLRETPYTHKLTYTNQICTCSVQYNNKPCSSAGVQAHCIHW